MTLDYKYTQEEFSLKTFSPKLLYLFLLLLFLFVVSLVFSSIVFYQLNRTDERILTGRYEQALDTLWRLEVVPFVKGKVYERIGTAELLLNGKDSAEQHFIKSEESAGNEPVKFWQEILKLLWSKARYEEGLCYTEHIEKTLPDKKVLGFYKIGFLAGLNQLEQAQKELAKTGEIPEFAKELSMLKEEIDHRISTNQYTLVYDRENLSLVSHSLKGGIQIPYEPVQTLLRTPAGDYPERIKGENRQAMLTLDYRIQAAATKALEPYAGAIVLLDVEKGDILAAASSWKGKNSTHAPGTPLAMTMQYEPGSIIKMITLAGALENGSDPLALFPMKCEGSVKLSNNRILYCSKTHGEIKDVNVATAVSCNVAFARMGLDMKNADLISNLRKFGFDAQLSIQHFPMQLGKLKQSNIDDQYIGYLSIGLEYLTMTPIHAAMLGSAIANHGLAMTPRLLMHYRNLIGIPYSPTRPQPFRQFMNAQTAGVLTKAMEQVVLQSEGTGKRVAMAQLPVALKTGTAGEGGSGYNAILMGFAPVKKPKVAFAVVVEHSGKAEFEGARITRLFLESIQQYIQ
jgi:peptidoglycan glycosyltransferase